MSMVKSTKLADDLVLIDTYYAQTPEGIGVYLLQGDQPALIETGPTSTLDTLLDGLRAAGVDPGALRAVAVTHIHLDHAGAAGMLVRKFPHLVVYVHPVGAPHLIDPSKLLASAGRLYGDDLHRLFGEVIPVPNQQVRILRDGDVVTLGSRRLVALDTPGHARHHHAYWDAESKDLFAGDIAGVAFPGTRFVRPPTPPPEFDVQTWHKSVALLRRVNPRRLLLTHFGPHEWVEELLAQLDARLDQVTEIVRRALAAGLDEETIVKQLAAATQPKNEMGTLGARRGSGRDELIFPNRLNAKGIIRYLTPRPTHADRPRDG